MTLGSTACQTCKNRRIKCDGISDTKPTCLRCKKSRRSCIEATNRGQGSLIIHHENEYASGETKRPRGPRASLIKQQPQIDLLTRALNYYMQAHIRPHVCIPTHLGNLSNCIDRYKASPRQCPMIDLALASIALAVFSKTQSHPYAAIEASSRYGTLLKLMQTRVPEVNFPVVDSHYIDSCLLTVFLMSRYEGTFHGPNGPHPQSSIVSPENWSHHDGAMAMLKVWHDKFTHLEPSPVVKFARAGTLKSCLLRGLAIPDWIKDGSKFGKQGPDLDCDRLLVQIYTFHYHASRMLDEVEMNSIQAETLLFKGHVLIEALQAYERKNFTLCSFQRCTLENSTLPKRHCFSSTVLVFQEATHTTLWAYQFALAMLLSHTMLRIIDLFDPKWLQRCSNNLIQRQTQSYLQENANSLASTIPFALERIKMTRSFAQDSPEYLLIESDETVLPFLANSVVWPLTIASALDKLEFDQKQWFRSELAHLGRITGDGILECAETRAWVAL